MDIPKYFFDSSVSTLFAVDDPLVAVLQRKLLAATVEKQENVLLRSSLARKREAVLLLPAFVWLHSIADPSRRGILYLSADAARAAAAAATLEKLRNAAAKPEAMTLDETWAGTLDEFLSSVERGSVDARSFGFLIVDGADAVAEMPDETLKRLYLKLLPPSQRRTVVVAEKVTQKAKNLAWTIAENPAEIRLGDMLAYAEAVPTLSFDVAGADKFKALLWVLDGAGVNPGDPAKIRIFCNLEKTAEEVTRRLELNGFRGTSVSIDRTDESDRSRAFALLLINYDVPLEAENYFHRISTLDIADSRAKLVNLVCDRYIFGLPPIERVMETSFHLSPLPSEASSRKDASAGQPWAKTPSPPQGGAYARARAPGARKKENGKKGGQPIRADLYSMSMEERIEIYKKKYDSRPAAEKGGKKTKFGQRGGRV